MFALFIAVVGMCGQSNSQTIGHASAQCDNYQRISCCKKENSDDSLLAKYCSPLDTTDTVPNSTTCSTLHATMPFKRV